MGLAGTADSGRVQGEVDYDGEVARRAGIVGVMRIGGVMRDG